MLERAWADAITRRDAAVINRIMADDFEGIDPAGNIFTKATYMPDLRNGVFASAPIELDEIKTRIFGDTGRRHQPDQDRDLADMRSDDERLRQAAGALAMRRLACQLDLRRGVSVRRQDRPAGETSRKSRPYLTRGAGTEGVQLRGRTASSVTR